MALFVIILIALLVLMFYINHKRKKITISQVNLITGAPKTCKSFVSVNLAVKHHKKQVFKTKFNNFFRKLFKKPLLEIPLLYSNIPLGVPHVLLTEELILREHRFRYNSTILIDEGYLVADSMTIKDDEINERLSYFIKLIGHEMKGGALFINTQNVHDLHFSLKRCATTYLFLTKKKSYPFFMNIQCRELVNSDEVPIFNTASDDIESDPSFHNLIIPKKYFKYYDCYAYSCLTDDKPVNDNVVIPDKKNLKTDVTLSIKKILKERKNNDKKTKN